MDNLSFLKDYPLQYSVQCTQCTMYTSIIRCILYIVQYTQYTIHVQCIPYTVHYTPYIIQCTPYIIHYTFYTVHCTVYSVHYTVYMLDWMFCREIINTCCVIGLFM